MMDDEKQLIAETIEATGVEVPVDESGNKTLTLNFLEKIPRGNLRH